MFSPTTVFRMQLTTTTSFDHHLRRNLQTPPQHPPPWPSLPPAPSPIVNAIFPEPIQIPSCLTSTTPIIILPQVPVAGKSYFDVVTVTIALSLIALSVISILLVFHLRVKARFSRRLHRFTFHSSTRILFATLVFLWAFTEIFRLPTSRIQTLIPSFPALNPFQKANLCKIQSVLSLGLFEPGFLVALLFLVKISITDIRRQRWRCDSSSSPNPSKRLIWSMLGCILTVCIPLIVTLHIILDYLPNWVSIPKIFVHTAVMLTDQNGERKVVLCAVPLAGAAVFGVFGVVYSLVLLMSCWRVISLAINKRLRWRINLLACTVLVCLAVQVLLLLAEVFWNPEEVVDYVLVLLVFVSVCVCAAVAEGILVILPIGDALSVGVGPPLADAVEEAAARQDALFREVDGIV